MPLTSAPPFWAEVVVLSALRGAVVGLLLRIPVRVSEVGIVSLSYPNRRKSVPPLADLEGQGRGPLGGGGSPVWIPYTFSADSSTVQGTHLLGFLFPNFHQGDRSGGCNSISCRDRGGQPSSSPFSGLLQPDVHRLEDLWVVETSDKTSWPSFASF